MTNIWDLAIEIPISEIREEAIYDEEDLSFCRTYRLWVAGSDENWHPIHLNWSNMTVDDGNHRFSAAKIRGDETIWVFRSDLSEEALEEIAAELGN